MEVISPEIFYRYIITNEGFNNDFSLYALNSELDDNGNIYNRFDLDVFNETGNWLDNQINTMLTEKDDSEVTYGNFKYLSTVVDEAALFPQYTELFSLKLLAFEKDRADIITFMDYFATSINNTEDELILKDSSGNDVTYDILIKLGKYSTPEYSDKQDIAGAERFIVSLPFTVTITSSLITTKKIKLYHLYNATFTEIPYIDFKFSRATDLVIDNKAGYEKLYDINKTDVSASLTAYYMTSDFCNLLMDFAIFPENSDERIVLKYVDTSSGVKSVDEYGNKTYNRENIFTFCISSLNIDYSFGRPVSFSVSFKTSLEVDGSNE